MAMQTFDLRLAIASEEVRVTKIQGLRSENGNSCYDDSSETSPHHYRRKTHVR